MKPGQKHIASAKRWLLFPLILFGLSIVFQARGTYAPVNDWLTDFRTNQTQIEATGEIGVIAIDPQSLQEIGTWPWSRAIHAEILDRLVDLGAGVILYDVNFAFPSDPEGDAAFADALDRAGGATLLATFSQRGLNGGTVHNLPYTPFNDRSWPAVVSVTPSESGQIRRYPTGATIDGQFIPSAGVQLAGSYASEASDFVVNYGIAPQTIPVFSVSDLLDGRLTADDIAGRSFLIGAATAELGDHFSVPLHSVIPGVMIHALAAETLLQGAEISLIPSFWLLPVLFVLLCALHFVGQQSAWRVVSLAFLASFGAEIAALVVFWSGFGSLPTALLHPALIILAIGRLAMTVDFSRLLIKRQNVQMTNAERLREHIFANSSDGFLAINNHDGIVFQSDAARGLLGEGTVPPGVIKVAQKVITQAKAKPLRSHLVVNSGDETKSIELQANASEMQRLDDGLNVTTEPLALITLRDVTDLRKKQRKIEYLSRHDDRTSALRRNSFCEVIESYIASGQRFAIVAISVNRLTAINATLGRDVGDWVLAEAVKRLRDQSAGLGGVARLEGNVFGVVIAGSTSDSALNVACERLQDLLARPYDLDGSHLQIGANTGYVAVDQTQQLDAEGYLSRAHDALTKARSVGNGAPSAFNSTDSDRRERARRLEHAMHHALDREEFHLLYQPQYRLSDRALIGAEALIRWDSAGFGNVSPVEFIPIAESSGFISDLGDFVLEQTIKGALALPKRLVMSPNVSAVQLLAADFTDKVAALLKRHGVSPDRLCLELTESEFLSPNSEAVERMRQLRSMGVTWALDDFGTGYSSLSYLKDLPFDKIKLDRAFLKDIFDDPMAQSALRSLTQLVQGYNKTLLCEGAETEKEVELLTQMGCDSVQGYFFGRPEPLERLIERAAKDEAQIATISEYRRSG